MSIHHKLGGASETPVEIRSVMMPNTYWSDGLGRRLARRRVLSGGAGGLAVAALLAACGGGSKQSGGSSGGKSGLIAQPVDTTRQAKRGGVWQWFQTADIVGLDPYFTS